MDIFLSYNWNNKDEANVIDNTLSSIGITIKRDINDIKYKDDLGAFMRSIRDADFSIILVSSDYIKSPNCLNELIELSKEKDFSKKILPIIIDGTKIYALEDRLAIIKYWEEKCKNLETDISSVSSVNAISVLQELKHYRSILSSIDEFLRKITSNLNITFSEATKNGFSDLLGFIGYDNNSIPTKIISIKKIENIQVREIELEILHNKYPKNGEIVFSLAHLNLMEIKNYHKARNLFKQFVNKFNSISAVGYNGLALSNFHLNEYKEAEKYFEIGLKINPKAYFILHNYGNLELKRKRFDKALYYFLETIKLYPYDGETFYNVAKLYTDFFSNPTMGIIYYKKAIEVEPDFYIAYNNLARAYIHKNNFELAKKLLEDGLSKNENDYIMLYNLATIYEIHLKDYKKAKSLYRRSINLNHEYSFSKIALGKLLISNFGEVDEAIELFEDVLSIEPSNDEALFQLCLYNITQRHIDKAREFYLKIDNPNYKKTEIDKQLGL